MFFSQDMLSLHRGKRRVSRTPTCRPCVTWLKDDPDTRYYGVVMDVSTAGVRIRMLDLIPTGCVLCFQMMRDEDFSVPLAAPLEGKIVRVQEDSDSFVDHGIQLIQKKLERVESRPVQLPEARPVKVSKPRMYSLDVTVGERPRGRSGR